ncbi:MAG: ComF family protein [Bacillota bacterium]
MGRFLRPVIKEIGRWLFPEELPCPFCGTVGMKWHPCPTCRRQYKLMRQQQHCPRCGRLGYQGLCPACQSKGYFQVARGTGPYGGIWQKVLYEFKYQGRRSLGWHMAHWLAETVLAEPGFKGSQLVVPVPVGPQKILERKFNQSAVLAEHLAWFLHLPVEEVLVRTRDTTPQSKLGRAARLYNLRDAFSLINPDVVRERKIILVDDVLTTGATAEECSRILLAAGAREVNVITWATGQREVDENGTKKL